MPLPLLIPAAVAASSQFSLATLIASITAALTGGLALGSQLSSSKSSEQAYDDPSFSSLIAELKDFPRQTKAIFADMFRDFREDSKLVVESTEKLSLLGAQLTDAAQTTRKNTKRLHIQVQEPLKRVETTLSTTQKKTDEVTRQLKKTQEELAQANSQISVLTVTLKEQQETVTRLNAEVVPLTKALAVQTKEKEKAHKKIETLKATFNQQQEGMKSELAAQVELNKRLNERLGSLESELERTDALYQKSLIQKQTIEALLLDYKTQQTTLLQRIKELEKECQSLTTGQELGSAESRATYEQQIKTLTGERQQLQESLKKQGFINKKLEETVQLLEQQATSLEASLTQLKGDYEVSKRNYQEVCLLTTSLNKEAQEQEALIAAQEQMIAKLSAAHSSLAKTPQGFFSKKAPVTTGAASQESSLAPQ